MPEPAKDLATYVATNLGTATLGTNAFYGPVKSPDDGAPAKAVYFIDGGGPPSEPSCGTSKTIYRATVQIWVRGDADDYGAGLAWANSIFSEVEHAPVSGYINVRNLRARPSYMGKDARAYHEWSWDAEMIFEETIS